jgi:predicted ATP-grasp superfamily ATP-dependent carboligase
VPRLELLSKRNRTPSGSGGESLSLGPAFARRRTATNPPAIVLGGYVAGLGVMRDIGVMGIPTVAVWNTKQEVARICRYAGIRLKAPHPERAEEDYIDLLVGLAERTEGGLLVPTSDPTLGVVARHKELLERYYDVACVDWEIAKWFLDKGHTYDLARRLGIGTPRTIEFGSARELEAAAKGLAYPCVVKPRHSHRYFERFGSKMAMARTHNELMKSWKEATELGLEVLVQEFIPGDDTHGVNYNAYICDGRPAVECTAQKLRLSPPQIGFPRVVVSTQIPEVIEPSRRLLSAVGFHGFANVEFKKDARDGTYKLMEVNGRHNNSGLLSVRAGVNFPWIMYRHLVQGEPPPTGLAQKNGIYWISVPSDPVRSVGELRKGQLRLRDYLRPYLQPHVFDLLDRRDLRPFLVKLAGALLARLHLTR